MCKENQIYVHISRMINVLNLELKKKLLNLRSIMVKGPEN
jgi:hypothetical protein